MSFYILDESDNQLLDETGAPLEMEAAINWFLRDDEGANTWASIEVTSVEADSAIVSYTVYDFQTVYADSPQIYYDVDSLVGTISGGAEFPFASATSDVIGYFNVLESAAQSDLVVSYSTRQNIDTQLYATWAVLTGVEVDSPEITYSHGGAVYSDEVEYIYTVFTGVETDATEVSYDVVQGITSDVGVTYAITSTPLTATNTSEIVYNIVYGVEKDGNFSANVLTAAEKDQVCQNNVLTDASLDRTVVFNVDSSVTSDGVFYYTLVEATSVTADSIYTYDVLSDSAIVPNVVGLTLEQATRVLVAAGFTVGSTTQVTLQ